MQPHWIWTSLVLPIIVAFIAAYVAHILSIRKAKYELYQEYNKKFNAKRWDVFLSFVNLVSELITYDDNINKGDVIETFKLENVSDDLLGIEQSILILGSEELIKEFGKWKVYNHTNGSKDPTTLLSLTSVINIMRKDLGDKNILSREQVLDILYPGWQRYL